MTNNLEIKMLESSRKDEDYCYGKILLGIKKSKKILQFYIQDYL